MEKGIKFQLDHIRQWAWVHKAAQVIRGKEQDHHAWHYNRMVRESLGEEYYSALVAYCRDNP